VRKPGTPVGKAGALADARQDVDPGRAWHVDSAVPRVVDPDRLLEYLRQSKVLAGGPGGGQGVAYYKGSSHVVWDLEAGCKYPRPLILPLA
jgi:hypothetical protein